MSDIFVDVSIVIPCHAGHAAVLPSCLASLLGQHGARPREILVINSNDDREVEHAVADSPVRLVNSNSGRLTAGAARNRGVAEAKGELVAFIDADCVAEPSWLLAIAQRLTGDTIAVSGPVLDYFPWHPIATADNRMQFIDHLADRPAGSLALAPSCNLAMPRATFLEAGGFPEQIQPGEDTILTAGLANRFPDGVRFEPAMRVRHRGRTSIREFLVHQRDFGFSRGRYGLNMTRRQQALCRHRGIAILAALRRHAYFMKRTAQWQAGSLPYLFVLTPLLTAGLAAWAQGLHQGCRLAGSEADPRN